ncbi:methyl-accepting chemotaxis protein [Candidatus Clostridium radicumherbarum]|uniref:Methyl-accepting chemotaxis protein n=1 Tax=Candidatus Clostridium radicumherbarum TaxID=3381662 RepID=A0ABW8TW28_9CLOT
MKRKRTLKTQLITLMLLTILFPVAIISIINSYSSEKSLNTQFKDTLIDNVNWTDEVIKSNNKSNIELTNMLSQDPNVQNIYNSADSEKWLLSTLDSFLVTHKDIQSVYYGLKDGRMLLKPQEALPKDYDPRNREWYTKALSNVGQVIITDPYEDASQKGMFVITYAEAVKDPKSGEINGVVAVDIKLQTLSSTISKYKIGQNGYIAIVDKTGTIISHNDPKMLGKTAKDEKWVNEIISSKQASGEYDINGQRLITYNTMDEQTGWRIMGFIPKNEITSQVNSQRYISAGISIIFLVLALIAGIIVSNSISKSIIKLVEVLKRIKDGDYTVEIGKHKNVSHEVGEITDSVDLVIKDMVEMLKNIIKTSKNIKESSEALVAVTEESNSVGEEVSRAVQQIAGGASEQAESLDKSSGVVSDLGEKVINARSSSTNMMNASTNVKEATKEGTLNIENLKETFEEASKANKELQVKIEDLANKSNRIGAITDTITSITEQTSLLSLNASIEAARAGEAGRGFAVVADEVRKLADQSANSALEINNVISEIRNSVAVVLERIEQTITLNEKSEEKVIVTSSSFIKIEEAVLELEQNINVVDQTLEGISSNTDEVFQSITEVAAVAEETAATAEEVSASSEEQSAGLHEVVVSAEQLNLLSEKLDEMVKKFKIE